MKNKFCLLGISAVLLICSLSPVAFASSRLEDAKQMALSGNQSERLQKASEQRITLVQRFSSVSYPSIQSFQIMPDSPFMKPTVGTFTSKYGWRDIGSGPEFHFGVDVANATGTNVVAAAEGTISFAGIKGSYGNVVMVSHFINDIEFTTLYAHLSRLHVLPGQQVMQGQSIGAMGSTGRSTGPHLHFELHEGTWNGSRTNAVDPKKYIKF